MSSAPTLNRRHCETSRSLDFLSRKELIAQTGHQVSEWPLVCLKELLDNSIDACEESGVAPVIAIDVDENSISVSDNGPGIPASVLNQFWILRLESPVEKRMFRHAAVRREML